MSRAWGIALCSLLLAGCTEPVADDVASGPRVLVEVLFCSSSPGTTRLPASATVVAVTPGRRLPLIELAAGGLVAVLVAVAAAMLLGHRLAAPITELAARAPAIVRGESVVPPGSAPAEVATIMTLRSAPPAAFLPLELHRRPVCLISMLALADPDRAERLLAPLRSIGRPLLDLVTHRPYVGLQSMTDTFVPHGWHYYWKSAGLRDLGGRVIDTLVEHAGRAGSPWSYTLLFHLGGAVADSDPHSTAYSRRDVTFELNINAVCLPDDPAADAETAWVRRFAADLEPHAAGAYLNFLDRDDHHRMPAAFEPTAYQRLLDLRQRYDPDGVLHPRPLPQPVPHRA